MIEKLNIKKIIPISLLYLMSCATDNGEKETIKMFHIPPVLVEMDMKTYPDCQDRVVRVTYPNYSYIIINCVNRIIIKGI